MLPPPLHELLSLFFFCSLYKHMKLLLVMMAVCSCWWCMQQLHAQDNAPTPAANLHPTTDRPLKRSELPAPGP